MQCSSASGHQLAYSGHLGPLQVWVGGGGGVCEVDLHMAGHDDVCHGVRDVCHDIIECLLQL